MLHRFPFLVQQDICARLDDVVILGAPREVADEPEWIEEVMLDYDFGISVVDPDERLDQKAALTKAMRATTLLVWNAGIGFVERAVTAVGGYHYETAYIGDDEDEEAGTVTASLEERLNAIPQLDRPALLRDWEAIQKMEHPYALQAGWCLAKAYGLGNHHDSASLYLFKVLELAIKFWADTGQLSDAAVAEIPSKLLGKANGPVYRSMKELGFSRELVDWFWQLARLRNTTLGHGALEPMFTNAFKFIPELDKPSVQTALRRYSTQLSWDDAFFEQVYIDLDIMARICLAKMIGVRPTRIANPGCWFMPTDRGEQALKLANVLTIGRLDLYEETDPYSNAVLINREDGHASL